MSNSLTKTLTVAAAIACTLATAADAAMTISNAKTKNVNCAGGVCTPTGGNPNLNVGDLQTMLASSDVTVKSNVAAPDIGILDPLTWASTHRLTLDAYVSIHVRAPLAVEGTAGVTLITNDGGSGGDYNFNAATSGAITFWDTASSLVINGNSFTLVNDIKTLAGDIATGPSGNFALAKNYDASADGTYPDAPVPTTFTGTFEGLGNTIQNLSITSNTHTATGLFAELDTGGWIRDIGLSNFFCRCTGFAVGALTGESNGTIQGAVAAGTVSSPLGNYAVGGLTGVNNGTIAASRFTGTVSGHGRKKGNIGGLAGVSNGRVLQSSTDALVQDGRFVGGLVGSGTANIDLSSAAGTVKGHIAGGLIGGWYGDTISRSFSTANVFALDGGGLVGMTGQGYSAQIVADYATGSITGVVSAGNLAGIISENNGGMTIGETYATGHVKYKKNTCEAGFVGLDNRGAYGLDYWDTTTTQQSYASCNGEQNITGLTDAQLKSGLPAGFDPGTWGQNPNINHGWPYLLANPPQ